MDHKLLPSRFQALHPIGQMVVIGGLLQVEIPDLHFEIQQALFDRG
jgi:hypothetical protein